MTRGNEIGGEERKGAVLKRLGRIGDLPQLNPETGIGLEEMRCRRKSTKPEHYSTVTLLQEIQVELHEIRVRPPMRLDQIIFILRTLCDCAVLRRNCS
jgi:hypothetical protein